MTDLSPKVRMIAHYLPQFHPIPENDEWWGKGFTEWTHVASAKPMFRGHVQPKLPADLGYYDLRVPETRIAQADLASQYGIEGFCYWHYWFAGRRLLERPFDEVLKSREPNFPFCLGWANHSWSAAWTGHPETVFLEQTYPGPEDHENHFNALLPGFTDPRYITVDGKPLFLVFRPSLMPEPRAWTDQWRQLAQKRGFKGLFIIGITCSPWTLSAWMPQDYGYDACLVTAGMSPSKLSLDPLETKKGRRPIRQMVRRWMGRPVVRDYAKSVEAAFEPSPMPENFYPAALSNWDNSPRHGLNGNVLINCTPQAFRQHLRDGINQVANRDFEHRIVFLKSWNEWAEGNYLEPDQQYGHAFLEVIKSEVTKEIIADNSDQRVRLMSGKRR